MIILHHCASSFYNPLMWEHCNKDSRHPFEPCENSITMNLKKKKPNYTIGLYSFTYVDHQNAVTGIIKMQ